MKPVGSRARPNPFPGLRPFRSDEHHLFFGREEQTAALLQLLRTNRFLAIVGTSGSGKSSLVRAGMIAELSLGHAAAAISVGIVRIELNRLIVLGERSLEVLLQIISLAEIVIGPGHVLSRPLA